MELYAPKNEDLRTTHEQDEPYVVIPGSGEFVNGGDRHPFGSGDVLFVSAGQTHRFEDFTDDFKTRVTFHGPRGGERAGDS